MLTFSRPLSSTICVLRKYTVTNFWSAHILHGIVPVPSNILHMVKSHGGFFSNNKKWVMYSVLWDQRIYYLTSQFSRMTLWIHDLGMTHGGFHWLDGLLNISMNYIDTQGQSSSIYLCQIRLWLSMLQTIRDIFIKGGKWEYNYDTYSPFRFAELTDAKFSFT